MKWPISFKHVFLSAFIFLLVAAGAQEAVALRVTMKRLVFEGPVRTEILTLVNNAEDEQVYRLGWRPMRMTEEESLIAVEDGASLDFVKPAEPMIRFAPRRVVLAPGASQQVRFMLRRPKDLADGEYRSHFWIQPEAEAVKFNPDTTQEAPGTGSSVKIKMLTGMTLPVFVRNGPLTATASITDLRAVRKGEDIDVSLVLRREGNRSLYGDIEFYCGAELYEEIRGVAVYTEVARRNLTMTIPAAKDGKPACSQMAVKFRAPEDDPLFKGQPMAEAALTF